YFMFDKRRHHVFDGALSRGKHRTVGGGLLAMNDDAIFLKHRVECIAGKPPPTAGCLLRDSATSKTW
ncbi:hypothetical protein PVFL_03425, partial [Pseudomonas viridiflava]